LYDKLEKQRTKLIGEVGFLVDSTVCVMNYDTPNWGTGRSRIIRQRKKNKGKRRKWGTSRFERGGQCHFSIKGGFSAAIDTKLVSKIIIYDTAAIAKTTYTFLIFQA
jgi:hypothetical protein